MILFRAVGWFILASFLAVLAPWLFLGWLLWQLVKRIPPPDPADF